MLKTMIATIMKVFKNLFGNGSKIHASEVVAKDAAGQVVGLDLSAVEIGGESMIKIFFSPQVSDKQIEYSFIGESITVKLGNSEDVFDFSDLPDGEIDMDRMIETVLPVNPVISAKRTNGILHLELLNWISTDAPHESRFPEWVELPLPKKTVKGKEPTHKAVIPWRSAVEIAAEKAATLAAKREKQERRSRITEGLATAKTNADLRSLMRDMAVELGIVEA